MNRKTKPQPNDDTGASTVRIIGGRLRGRKLPGSDDSRTRPMKDRVREAVFNWIGPSLVGSYAVDLFSGTGVVGFEAISRGAARATLVERHFPTADQIRRNATALGIADRVEVVGGDAFVWVKRLPDVPDLRWTVLCCPPYSLYEERPDDFRQLVDRLWHQLPEESVLMMEADERLDFTTLPQAEHWQVRHYQPSYIGRLRITREIG